MKKAAVLLLMLILLGSCILVPVQPNYPYGTPARVYYTNPPIYPGYIWNYWYTVPTYPGFVFFFGSDGRHHRHQWGEGRTRRR